MERRPILVELALTLGFLLLRLLHGVLQGFKWRLDGTARLLREGEAPEHYARSAQVLRVWRKHAFDPFVLHNTPGNFILHHQKFLHPDYVLKDEVSFYCLTKNEAIFVEAPPGVEVWRNEVSPFHKHAQYENAVNIIKMPLSSFHRLADELGPISQTLIFVDFIPRSGSTLMCRIFEETGECVSYSEPHALNDVFGAYVKGDDPEANKRSLQAQVRFLCKPRSKPTTAFMFKMLPSQLQSNVLGQYIREVFPDAKYLFLYRNGAPMARSLQRLMLQVNALRLVNMTKVFPSLWKRIRVWFVSLGQDFEPEVQEVIENTEHIEYVTCALFWALGIRGYMSDSRGAPAMKYEDIVDCPEASIRAIFQHCGLSEKLVPKAMRALEGDSQHSLALSWDELINLGWCEPEASKANRAAKQDMDTVCRLYGIPSVHEDCALPNTITVNAMDNNNYMEVNNNMVDLNNNLPPES